MGNGFFHIFFAGIFALMFAAGAIMYLQMEQETEDKRAVNKYLFSNGAAPLPSAWRSQVGKGI